MTSTVRRSLSALATGGALLVLAAIPQDAYAQAQPAATPAAKAAPADTTDAPREVALTDKQIEGVLAAQKDFDAIAEKMPQDATDQPDPKVTAELDAVAKKHGFASYDEYNDVLDTISLVLSGFDPKTKKYVGPEAVIKGQIATIEADKSIPADDKKQALAQLNDALKHPAPPLQNKGNIELVSRYYDKLSATMEEGD
jgi:hypothetical protein